MLSRSHIVFAFFIYLIYFQYIPEKIFFLAGLILATFFVDIDTRKSKISSYWIIRPVSWFFSHRGMIHSLFSAFVISLLLFFFQRDFAIGFFIGYLLHLFLDLVTKEGVNLFWPFSRKISLLYLKTGGLIEEVFFVLILLADLFLISKIILRLF